MYFENFNSLIYAFVIKGDVVVKPMLDITKNVRPLQRILDNTLFYGDYDIEDGDTPEVISERIYGNPSLHWVLMLINEKYDYLEDWPMPENKLEDYVTKKYGVGNENATHLIYGREHWINTDGRIVDAPTNPDSLSIRVTNTDYERDVNEAKRRIRIVHPNLISVFVKDLEEAFIS